MFRVELLLEEKDLVSTGMIESTIEQLKVNDFCQKDILARNIKTQQLLFIDIKRKALTTNEIKSRPLEESNMANIRCYNCHYLKHSTNKCFKPSKNKNKDKSANGDTSKWHGLG